MESAFRLKHSRGPQFDPPRPKACPNMPPHSRELAPHRLDAVSIPSQIRPTLDPTPNPCPLAAPQYSPRRIQNFSDSAPLPPPVFHNHRRSQPYPSTIRPALVNDLSFELNPPPVHDLPMLDSGLDHQAKRSSAQPALQQTHEIKQRRLAESLFEQICYHCCQFSNLFGSDQSLLLRSDMTALLIRQFSPSTIKRYCISVLNLIQWLVDLELDLNTCTTIQLVDVLRLMHSEWSETDPDSDSLQLSPLISLNTLKAIRWTSKVLQLQMIDLYSPIFSSLSFSSKETHESFPLPLYVVHELELSLLKGSSSLRDRVFKGSLLVCIWASLRFNDAQHVHWNKLILDNISLRASCFQAKSSKSGYPFAVQCLGLIAETPHTSWLLKWLEALNEVWDASITSHGPNFVPDHLFPSLDDSGAIVEPMSYAQTIARLRKYLNQIEALRSCSLEYTLHSAKATMLSWACQLNLDSHSRALQGHHKPSLKSSVNLYGRDSVHAPLDLQSTVRAQIIESGFRPSTPLHRGAQCPVVEPAVTLMIKNAPFDIRKMNLHHFRILLSHASPPIIDPIEIEESPVDSPRTNHIPDPELDELSLFIITPKIVHVAAWTVQFGLDFRGCAYRPKCGARIVPGSQVSEELPQAVRMCKRKACLAALHILEKKMGDRLSLRFLSFLVFINLQMTVDILVV